MGLRFVFAFGLVGLGLVCVGFGSQAEPIMGLGFVFAFDSGNLVVLAPWVFV